MSRFAFISRLAAVVVLVNLFVIALAAMLLIQSRTQYHERAAIVAQNLSQVLEQNISSTITRIDLALLSTAHEAEEHLATGTLNAGYINAYIAWQFAQQPDLEALRIADSHGTILYGIGVKPGSRISTADRDYFIRLRDEPNAGLAISKPLVGRISGKWTVAFARRLNHADGAFAGVVYAVVSLEHFQKMFAALDMGPNGAVIMRELDLSMIVRYPEPQVLGGPVGNKSVSKDFLKAIRSNPNAGYYRAITGIDHIARTFSYRRISKYPGYIVIGLATDDYLEEWRNIAFNILALVILFALTTLIAAISFHRIRKRKMYVVAKLEESEHKYRLLFENMTAGFALHEMIYDEQGNPADYRFLEVNPAFEKLTGLSAAAILGKTVKEVLPNTEAYWIEQYGAVAGTGEPLAYQNYAGELGRYYDVWAFSPGKGLFAVIVSDISERKEAENKLRLMAEVFKQSGEAIVITTPDNKILATNRSFTLLTGYSQEDVLGKKPRILKSGRETTEFYEAMWQSLLKENYWQGEIWDRRKDGSYYPKWLTISVVRNGQGEIINYIASFSDITERKQAEQEIEHLAHHDPLTNLYNRFSLTERLSQSLEEAKRSDQHLAVIFIDLDRFKEINDSLGHHIGDMLLCEVAARLLASVRTSDIVARLGGDEFVVVLPQIQSGMAAALIVEKIRKTVSHTYLLDGRELYTSPSIGISVYPHDGATVQELMKNADTAMYHAKSQGRNNYQFFKQEMNTKVHERLLLESELQLALARDELFLEYQPQIDINAGTVIGVEALVRWRHPLRGIVPPDMFIPIAEETGLILPLGDIVLKTACKQLADWLSEGVPRIRMAVNLSARQFQQSDLPDIVARILTETGIDPRLLELEITESAAMNRPEETIGHLGRLKDMGIALAIDDFGTGYSSLTYLKLFPVNRLKIDRSFVNVIETDVNDAAIVAATIALAHTLGKEVVAEGVETEAQLDFLKYQQCDVVQGYWFSRPLSARDAADFVRRNHAGSKGP